VGALRKGRREGEGGWIDDGREGVGSGHGAVCIVGVDASAGMSNDETEQKKRMIR
jgi:hypothetical protein